MPNRDEPPNDYGQPSQYIIELMPKLVAWAIGVLQLLMVAIGGFALGVLLELKSTVARMDGSYASDLKSLTQRADRFEQRQDHFEERLGRFEGEGRR